MQWGKKWDEIYFTRVLIFKSSHEWIQVKFYHILWRTKLYVLWTKSYEYISIYERELLKDNCNYAMYLDAELIKTLCYVQKIYRSYTSVQKSFQVLYRQWTVEIRCLTILCLLFLKCSTRRSRITIFKKNLGKFFYNLYRTHDFSLLLKFYYQLEEQSYWKSKKKVCYSNKIRNNM